MFIINQQEGEFVFDAQYESDCFLYIKVFYSVITLNQKKNKIIKNIAS